MSLLLVQVLLGRGLMWVEGGWWGVWLVRTQKREKEIIKSYLRSSLGSLVPASAGHSGVGVPPPAPRQRHSAECAKSGH